MGEKRGREGKRESLELGREDRGRKTKGDRVKSREAEGDVSSRQ